MYQNFDFKPDTWGFHVLERDIKIYSSKLHYRVHIDAIGYLDGWFCILCVDDDKMMAVQRLHCARKMMYRYIKRYAFNPTGYDRDNIDLAKFTSRMLYWDPIKMGAEEIKFDEKINRLVNHAVKLEEHRTRTNKESIYPKYGQAIEKIIDVRLNVHNIRGYKRVNT